MLVRLDHLAGYIVNANHNIMGSAENWRIRWRLPISVGLSAQQSPGDLRHAEEFTQIDVPGASFTAALAINPQGDIVGNSSGNVQGFLLSKSTFTTIDVPAATDTIPFGINPQGEIVGGIMTAAVTSMVIC